MCRIITSVTVFARWSAIGTASTHRVACSVITSKYRLPLSVCGNGPITSTDHRSPTAVTGTDCNGGCMYLSLFINWHCWHVNTYWATSSLMPGQYELCRSKSVVLAIPVCAT
ncbi:hypothetical protein Smp_165510 [Schistosoma mansoni]|uniref:hypothetical protein n=1 Tax=Schistosoma mansoni TaxID=6183 RepID=UPI00019B3752|nr:hypothetical protein Smp_165510 [Schistosoma mansoni]|eukprot:XP_018648168.1 hypothetical protein Smp_165510 [Schistosoma mansoni]